MQHSASFRHLFSAALLVTGILFAVAHGSNGATMNAITKVASESVKLPDLFHFTLLGTLSDEWNAGTYVLCALVGFFSGTWPFLKLAFQAMLFWLPTAWISPRWQGLFIRLLVPTMRPEP